MADGKTPAMMLGEQLDLIEEKMQEISTAIARDDVGRLLAQGRFLEERFGRVDQSLTLKEGQASAAPPPALEEPQAAQPEPEARTAEKGS